MNSRKKLSTLFDKHQHWLAITGAGISVDSGIPTYRDAAGNWLRSDPIKHQEFIQHEYMRKRYWTRSIVGWPPVSTARPNKVHELLVQLERQGSVTHLITQNVDRLHQKAGHQKVVDLHGRLDRVVCLSCNRYEERDQLQLRLLALNPYLQTLEQRETITRTPDGDALVEDELSQQLKPATCLHCGGTLMPDVVFFGGMLLPQVREQSLELVNQCDALLVCGSSLMVFSAYRLCKLAVSSKKPLVIINQGVTRGDSIASLKIAEDCAMTLQALVN